MRMRSVIAASVILSAASLSALAAEGVPIAQPYEDRIIAPGELPAESSQEQGVADLSGLPRALRVEIGIADTEYGDMSRKEGALALWGFWDTISTGSWSIDGVLRSGESSFGGNGSSVSIWQRRMPFADGWHADNGLGVVSTPTLPLMRNGYRFTLPITALAGVESDWTRDDGSEFQAAFGDPGYFVGGHWSSFERTGGQVTQLGAQLPLAADGAAAFAIVDAHNVLPWFVNSLQNTQGVPRVDARSAYAAAAWNADSTQLQGNVLLADNGMQGNPLGAWVDATTSLGNYQQHYGLFRLDPNLSWGAQPFSNDIEGGYYRIAYQRAQWTWSAGLDEVRSISGNGVSGSFFNGTLRDQIYPWFALGGDVTAKPGSDSAYSGAIYADLRSGWGGSRLQLQQAESQGLKSRQISWDQALPLREGIHVDLTAAIAAIDSPFGGTTRSESLAAYGNYEFGYALSLNGNIRWTRGQGPEGQRGLDGNLSLNWRLNNNWSIAATYYQSQATQRSVFVIDPIAQATPFVTLPRTWAYSLLLRYERQAGSPVAVIGGSAHGVGSISGSVFLDANNNGRREASEAGAASVTVVLDGRYAMRTDGSGHFDFFAVGAGEHVITVVADNLPLPWMFDERNARKQVVVSPRERAYVEIAAKRP